MAQQSIEGHEMPGLPGAVGSMISNGMSYCTTLNVDSTGFISIVIKSDCIL